MRADPGRGQCFITAASFGPTAVGPRTLACAVGALPRHSRTPDGCHARSTPSRGSAQARAQPFC